MQILSFTPDVGLLSCNFKVTKIVNCTVALQIWQNSQITKGELKGDYMHTHINTYA